MVLGRSSVIVTVGSQSLLIREANLTNDNKPYLAVYKRVSIPFNQGGKSYTRSRVPGRACVRESQSLLIREANLTACL